MDYPEIHAMLFGLNKIMNGSNFNRKLGIFSVDIGSLTKQEVISDKVKMLTVVQCAVREVGLISTEPFSAKEVS